MPADLETSISFLESTNDPSRAYFSYTVDDSGEYGLIRANKEGLRLYAAELLKKSMEMEERQDGQTLYFGPLEWVVSDAGYDLIAGVAPVYRDRNEALRQDQDDIRRQDQDETRRSSTPDHDGDGSLATELSQRKGCLFSMLTWLLFPAFY
jgi:hypothetical protein